MRLACRCAGSCWKCDAVLHGHEYTGESRNVSTDAITLATGKSDTSVERPRVRRVQVRSGNRRVRKAVIGTAIGVASE